MVFASPQSLWTALGLKIGDTLLGGAAESGAGRAPAALTQASTNGRLGPLVIRRGPRTLRVIIDLEPGC